MKPITIPYNTQAYESTLGNCNNTNLLLCSKNIRESTPNTAIITSPVGSCTICCNPIICNNPNPPKKETVTKLPIMYYLFRSLLCQN